MSTTRWKMMAGILVVSLGGLAAMAGQCPKSEPMKGNPPPDKPVVVAPVSAPVVPLAPSLPSVPAPEPVKPVVVPPAPALPVVPASGTVPVPPAPAEPAVPAIPPATTSPPPPPALPMVGTEKPAVEPPGAAVPPMPTPADPLIDDPGPVKLETVKPAAITAAVTQAKYRIVLRVGEGEPVFEVRTGDNLMLKVVCERVDVKSPDKGQGPSAVKACGKVRFAGFGAAGTCDELNFLAGTGEVALAGHVQIQVKDKLGRVESELSAETMKYKIDPQMIAGNGQLKP